MPNSSCGDDALRPGYQAGAEEAHRDTLPGAGGSNGRIVAWSVALGKPGPKQTAFFEERYGGTSQAAVVVLDPGTKLTRTVKAKAPLQKLTDFFGQTPQFPLAKAIRIRKGQYVGLTVPTWAPVLQIGLPSDTSWRSSRPCGLLGRHDAVRAARRAHVGDVPLPLQGPRA